MSGPINQASNSTMADRLQLVAAIALVLVASVTLLVLAKLGAVGYIKMPPAAMWSCLGIGFGLELGVLATLVVPGLLKDCRSNR